MKLCFGTFATVLYICNQDITQPELVGKLAKAVDPKSRYAEDTFPENQKADANKLIKCKIKFHLSSGKDTMGSSLDAVVEDFENEIAPFINEDKKAKVILALLDIIKEDDSIDFTHKENFKKYLGMEKYDLLQQCEFKFSDFLGRILLYTVCGNVDNTVGQECVGSITSEYIDNVAKPYEYEYQWDSTTQTITLTFATMFDSFQQIISRHDIDVFIYKIDPSLGMADYWPEKHDAFIADINNTFSSYKVANRPIEKLGFTLTNIKLFAQIFDEYANYLGCHMDPIIERDALFPRFPKDDYSKWALAFVEKIKEYCEQLNYIYQIIYTHMLYAPYEYNSRGAQTSTSE